MRIAAGTQDKLYLGNINLQRDWGWADDHVEAMYLMLQQEQFSFREAIARQTLRYRQRMTIRVATGKSYKLALFIEMAFRLVGLDWREDVSQ